MASIDGAVQIRKAIERILAASGLLERFLSGDHFQAQILNGSFMPLVVERHGQVVIVAHVTSQNGDAISDPEMTFKIVQSNSEWFLWPTSLQFATGHREDCEAVQDGRLVIKPRAQADQIRFSNEWARNLISQGFHRRDTASPETSA